MHRIIQVFLLVFSFATAANAQSIYVIDGDTIVIGELTHRLHGIDAPEFSQSCKDSGGGWWPCGQAVTETLRDMAANGAITCSPVSKDYYGRNISKCLYYGKDLNARLVRNGLAWAFRRYSTDYVEEEEQAKAEKLGIWQAHNMKAEVFRDMKWQLARDEAPKGCAIKGNINRQQERIYHMPWDKSYAKTVISPQKGERWFCDEAEAIAAGWRAVKKW